MPHCSQFPAMIVLGSLFALGCGGGEDPLGLEHRRDPSVPAVAKTEPTSESKPTEAPASSAVVAPTLLDAAYDQTRPGAAPAELLATIQKAADHLARDERGEALALLADPNELKTQGTTAAELGKTMPRINVLLLEGTLRQAAKSSARLNADGTFALFEVSDSSYVRFNRIDGHWRLSENRRPDASRPGVRYEEPEPHAKFLLQEILQAEPLESAAPAWAVEERPVVQALIQAGAGIARGRDAAGQPATAVVLNRKFQGPETTLADLKKLNHVRIVALYDPPILEARYADLAALPELQGLRILRDTMTDESVRAAAGCRRLRNLNLAAVQRSPISPGPLGSLAELQHLDLLNLSFDPESIGLLAPLTRLKRLNLSNCPVDDATLAQIPKLASLESLMITPESVSADAIFKLRREVPKLFIDW